MLYWSGFTASQWDTFTESGWYYFELDGFPSFRGSLYSSLQYEDLQTYLPASSLYDNSVYDHVDVGSGYALVTGLLSTTTTRAQLYKDGGVGYYSGILDHKFTLQNILPVGQYGLCDVWALSNTVETESEWNINSSQAVRLALNNGRLSLREHEDARTTTSTYLIASGINYYINVIRSGTHLTAYTFDNPSYSGLYLDSISVLLPTDRSYRYLWVLNKPNYGALNTGHVSFISSYFDLHNNGWIAEFTPKIGISSSIDGVATFSGILSLVSSLGGSLSGYGIFGGDLHIGISSGIDLYIKGMDLGSEAIPLYISGAYPTIGGILPLYIGASGVLSTLYLYTEGLGTNAGYYPLNDYIPLFIGNPSTTYLYNSLPLYLDCAEGTFSSGLYLYCCGASPLSSGLDLYISGVGDVTNTMKLYIHGY